MQALYFILVAVHILSMTVSGILWVYIILVPTSGLKKSFRDIRAVHFGSMHLTAWFLGLAFAFDQLNVPDWHQIFFPVGLGLLVTFSSIAYMLPRPEGLDPFYYWTVGWGKVLAIIGLACLVFCLTWTSVVLVIYALK